MTKKPAGAPKNGHYKAYILGEGKTVLRRRRVGGANYRRIALLSWREPSGMRHAYLRGWARSVVLMEKSPRARHLDTL